MNSVIPTERGTSDGEFRVGSPQFMGTQGTYCRSSRRFAPQDDRINGLATPLSMTSFGECYYHNIVILNGSVHSEH